MYYYHKLSYHIIMTNAQIKYFFSALIIFFASGWITIFFFDLHKELNIDNRTMVEATIINYTCDIQEQNQEQIQISYNESIYLCNLSLQYQIYDNNIINSKIYLELIILPIINETIIVYYSNNNASNLYTEYYTINYYKIRIYIFLISLFCVIIILCPSYIWYLKYIKYRSIKNSNYVNLENDDQPKIIEIAPIIDNDVL